MTGLLLAEHGTNTDGDNHNPNVYRGAANQTDKLDAQPQTQLRTEFAG
ncbi:MAG: hypothetical protein U0936_20500 [Planctomycetaceae bacterium]